MSRTLSALALAAMFALGSGDGWAADTEKKGELPAKSGATFERDGLKFVLTMPRAEVRPGKPLAFDISVENVSKNDRTIVDSHCFDADFWKMQMIDAKGQEWQVVAPPRSAGPPSVPIVFHAGEKRLIKFTATEHYRYVKVVTPRLPLFDQLPNGAYVLSIQKAFPKAPKAGPGLANPVWSEDVLLEKIAFTVVGAAE